MVDLKAKRRSLILAQLAQSALSSQFYFLKADLNLKYKGIKICKKITHFYTHLKFNFEFIGKEID